MSDRFAPAPRPAHRLVPSRFPPIGLFDTVATAADLAAVMELAGWTNDRLVAERVARLPRAEWVYGRPNASVVMAAFLHAAPGGMRFNAGALGAWYAAATLATAAAEVAHHLRREAVARGEAETRRVFRQYVSVLEGTYLDIRGEQAAREAVYDPTDHAAGQALGEAVRAGDGAGIVYDSLRHAGGVNVVAYRPRLIGEVAQGEHFEITARVGERLVAVRRMGG